MLPLFAFGYRRVAFFGAPSAFVSFLSYTHTRGFRPFVGNPVFTFGNAFWRFLFLCLDLFALFFSGNRFWLRFGLWI